MIGASHQIALEHSVPGYHVTSPTPASPGYFGVIPNWDGNWYRSIAQDGYPRVLPVDDQGVVQPNVWAFYPVYPLIVRGVMALTGTSFSIAAWGASLLFGACAMVAVFRLVRPRVGTFTAGALVASLMAYVTAPVLQVAYTESIALLLVVLFIGALQRRRLLEAVLWALVLSLTRPIALPLGLVMGVVLLSDWLVEKRREPRPSVPLRSLLATAAVFGTAALWPLIAWVATGRPRAFFETQAAWPVNHDGLGGWLGDMVHLTSPGIVAVGVALFVVMVAVRPGAALWGSELRAWSVVYPAYLLVFSRPSPSIFRYLFLAIAPLWPFPELALRHVAAKRWAPWAVLGVVVLFGLTMQYFWVTRVFTAHDPAVQLFP